MSLCVEKVVGILNDAGHAAGLICIVQGGSEFIQNGREDLQPKLTINANKSGDKWIKKQ